MSNAHHLTLENAEEHTLQRFPVFPGVRLSDSHWHSRGKHTNDQKGGKNSLGQAKKNVAQIFAKLKALSEAGIETCRKVALQLNTAVEFQ